MDIFGIGGPELIVLVLLGIVILGPRRVAGLWRDIGGAVRQIQNITSNITKEINREINQLELKELEETRKKSQPPGLEAVPYENGSAQLPEAYQRFREDFPDEGDIESPGNTQSQDIPAEQ